MSSPSVKILEVGNYPPPRCGWSTRIEHLAESLRSSGQECRVLDIGPSRKIRRSGCVDVQNGVDYLRKLIRFGIRGYRFHLHANGDSPKGFVLTLIALVLARMLRRPAFLTFHAGVQQRFFPRRTPFWSHFFRVLFGLPTSVICNSEPVKSEIQRYGVEEGRIHVIPAFSRQYTEPEAIAELPPPQVASFIRDHRPVLLCYAFHRPEFVLDQFLRSVSAVQKDYPELGLLMVGEPEDHDELAGYAEELGIGDRVLFAGNLPRDAFLAAMRDVDLYVRTHLRDGVSSSVLEAVSLGTPVLAAENESRPETVATYEGESEGDLIRSLRTQLDRLANGEAPVVASPTAEDTVAQEVELLCADI